MKTHTNDLKNTIKQFGRELDSKITYGLTELGKEQLNSVTPHYESSILKSVMKQLDIDSNIEIPLETVINYQFGVKVGNSYEYLNYGNYVVYNVEKQEDTRSWKITCYDKMLYAMKDYESLGVTYPISVKNFLVALCTKIGLTLANDDFVNADKMINSELYLDSDGNSLGYTYRDVLDEIAQVVAGIICINNNDELEVRYPSNVGEYETKVGTVFYIDNVDDVNDFSYELQGNTIQDGTPTPESPIPIQVVTGQQTIKVCGKNLFDKDTNSPSTSSGWKTTPNFIPVIGGSTLTASGTLNSYNWSLRVYEYDSTKTIIGNYKSYAFLDRPIKFTVSNDCCYIKLGSYGGRFDTSDWQLEYGTEASTYEEYLGQDYEINLGNIELCKIEDYKDKIYKQNNKWYLEKQVGKVVLDGTQSIAYSQQSNGVYLFNVNNALYKGLCLSNRFIYNYANTNGSCYISSSSSRFGFCNTSLTSNASALQWLSNNNVIGYYQLATPTTTEITDTELLGQLEAIRLQLGIDNVTVNSANLSSPLKLTYLSELETIDEEMLKDVNINFGDKFGPVNSVVLSRSAESDNIYRKDDESVELNGLTEIKISDNQILNGNDRYLFIDDIFNKLNGLEYYVNDYVSTGIAYLELGDIYKVKVENNSYKCLMLNDELDVTQGLEEPIHAERIETSETDYTKADKTDRRIKQAYIIVDKQNSEINSVVESIDTINRKVDSQGNQIDALGTRITQTETDITARVTSVEGQLQDGVNLVKTTSVTINDEGLTVATDTSKIATTMTNEKFKVSSGGKDLAYFGYDEDTNSTKAQMDNLTVTNYFVAGYHRIEKYEDNLEHRTGAFYIGG